MAYLGRCVLEVAKSNASERDYAESPGRGGRDYAESPGRGGREYAESPGRGGREYAESPGRGGRDYGRGSRTNAQRDPMTFTAIYRRYLDRVYRYLRYRVGNEQDAQDLTTQTFMAALANLPSYRGEGTVSAWLLGIASHKLVDWQRKEPVTAPLAAALTMPDETELPEDLVIRQFERQGLEEALLLLAPERAEAIALRYFGELTNGEVAKIMGKQEAAVKMLIHCGLQDRRMRYRVPIERAEEGER